jgi:DNA-directed RNA polymerase specialized sigma24 family protein
MDPDTAAEDAGVIAAHDAVLDSMRPIVRDGYTLCRQRGLTYADAAVVLGCKVVTMRGAVSRALRMLRMHLGAEFSFKRETQRQIIRRLRRPKESE